MVANTEDCAQILQGVVLLTADPCSFKSQFNHITFVEIDLEIISAVILSLLLIQEG